MLSESCKLSSRSPHQTVSVRGGPGVACADGVRYGEGNAAFCEGDPYKVGTEDALFDKVKKSLIRRIGFLLAGLRDCILKSQDMLDRVGLRLSYFCAGLRKL